MADSKKNKHDKTGYDNGNDHNQGGERPRRKRDGRERKVHEQIVARRLEGGAPATPEAYAKALEEWQKLPGAVIKPATDIGIIKNAESSFDNSDAGSETISDHQKEEDKL